MKRYLPDWLENAIFYQIYPQSYYDTNADGIGDLPGITQKLDYVQSLGCNAIWLNPCFESPFQDAGYDISDFYKVASRYGTNADLKRLFAQARRRGIRVVLDLVAGHTSIEHPWFKESSRPERNKYSDWFIWTSDWITNGYPAVRTIGGYAQRNAQFMINFFYSQPALNYGFIDPSAPWQMPIDAPGPRAVRAELKKIMRFWLDMGCDGFRVDCAPACIKAQTREKMFASQNDLWQDVHDMLSREYPESVLVAEWFNPAQAVEAGFHVDFPRDNGVDMGLDHVIGRHHTNSCKTYFAKSGDGDACRFFDAYFQQEPALKGRGYVAFYTGNHDNYRMSLGKDKRMQEMVFAMVLTLPGVPFIYYGDEIGMRYLDVPTKEGGYTRTGCRTPMQWSAKRNAGFSDAPAKSLYLPIDPRADRPTVAAQEDDPLSLLNTVRALTSLRRNSKALSARGEFRALHLRACAYPLVYLRRWRHERYIIALNPCRDAAKVSLETKAVYGSRRADADEMSDGIRLERLNGFGADITRRGSKLIVEMRGCSYGIFRA